MALELVLESQLALESLKEIVMVKIMEDLYENDPNL